MATLPLSYPGLASVQNYGRPRPLSYPTTYGGSVGSTGMFGAQSQPARSFGIGSDLGSGSLSESIGGFSSMGQPAAVAAPASVTGGSNTPTVPDVADKGFFKNLWGDDGFTLGDIGALTEIIGGFGDLWMGFQANKLAKQSLQLQRDSYETNLANATSAYNLALEDRVRGRYDVNNQDKADAYIAKHRLGS